MATTMPKIKLNYDVYKDIKLSNNLICKIIDFDSEDMNFHLKYVDKV